MRRDGSLTLALALALALALTLTVALALALTLALTINLGAPCHSFCMLAHGTAEAIESAGYHPEPTEATDGGRGGERQGEEP